MDRTAYKNRHIKEHYDRINLVIPKCEKDRIKGVCSEMGASVNEYLDMLVCNDLVNGTSRMAAKKQGFSVEQERMLEKWQVPRKYYEMIEDLSTGFLVWGCYDANYDHLWTLEDVEEFIKGEYEKAKIVYQHHRLLNPCISAFTKAVTQSRRVAVFSF